MRKLFGISTAVAALALTGIGVAAPANADAAYPVVANVNVRSGPSTSYKKVAIISAGSPVAISCQTPGQTVAGPLGTSPIWDRIGGGGYVSDTFVRTGTDGYVTRQCPRS